MEFTNTGIATAIFKIDDVPNTTGKAVHYDSDTSCLGPSDTCFVGQFGTTHWKQTISASGQATVICHFELPPL